ncbi:MAG: flagellar biosynthetic protein FliO [Acidobacteriia bacterium]|nr:flagellar biosynthetic protein FliO [Terriglobia bacterium]
MLASSVDGPSGESRPGASKLAALVGRILSAVSVRRRERRLRLCEMLPLGEKRFVAVVEYGSQRFLLAGTPQTISLLKYLDGNSAPGEAPRAEQDRD